ncbi:MAG: hypothetical protein NVS9B15_11010 [Acidobacteriaceae bacterium]
MSNSPPATVNVPGPLRSLLRMAGISQKAQSAEVLPFLARRVYQDGFGQPGPSEFLKLLRRYVQQARELQALAGPKQVLQVSGCQDSGKLLGILGYRLPHGCGDKDTTVQAADAERAFLTVDSGFPITDLEEALQKNAPFVYPYASEPLPVLFQPNDWYKLGAEANLRFSDMLDLLLSDPAPARLYWALSQPDTETANFLEHSVGLKKLQSFTSLLDLYGSQLSIHSNHVLVPGGAAAERGWTALVGASPGSPANFVELLYARDGGWLAAYFDVLSRVDPIQQQHLTQGSRLRGYYEAFRPVDNRSSAGSGVYRKATELLVLDMRIPWEANGDPHVPGTLDRWNKILEEHSNGSLVRAFMHGAHSLNSPDQLIEALAGASHEVTDAGPLQLYLTLCELDRRRAAGNPLSPETVSFLAPRFPTFHSWLLTFSEFPSLTDQSIVHFINIAESLQRTHGEALQANALGAFQANVGLWQILARQHQIPIAELNTSWGQMIDPFVKISSSAQLFDASRHSLREILHAAGGDPNGSPEQIVDLLAGPLQPNSEAQGVHSKLRERMGSILEDQRLASLDTLFRLSDGLQGMEQGSKGSDELVALAAELHEFELPRAIFTTGEKISLAPTVYMGRHAELQTRTDLTKILRSSATPAQLEVARGQLAAFLRDTLVGLNYAYYEPPGAQILHINPLFVRAHDFRAVSIIGIGSIWQAPRLVGAGVAAGGGAFLIGSLVDLPFALSTAEQDFIVPENIQSLVWREVVPDLLTAATLPRWWDVTPGDLHAVALYQRFGEEILGAALDDADLRMNVAGILYSHMSPRRFEDLQLALTSKQGFAALLPRLMPSDCFYLAEQFALLHREQAASAGPAGKELAEMMSRSGSETSPERLSARFGVPHPTLASSNAPEILNVRPFPTSGGYTNRVFGETLESPNLYWARLADELGYSPAMLNLLVPELTRVMVGKIFASEIEDFPAILRAMRETGDDLRQGRIASFRRTAVTHALEPAAAVRQPQ